MKKYILEIIVFICGAAVMVLELIGSRVLAPYLGTSIFVWTSLIGIILGSLSLGYFWGGKIADKYPSYRVFSSIIFFAGVWIGLIAFFKEILLEIIQKQIIDIRIGSIIAVIVLFALPSVLLGMVSPFAIRLKIKDIKDSGKIAGNLYAISTMGSIVGTFLAGFLLISYLGNAKILFLVSLTLIFASFVGYIKSIFKLRLVIFLILILSMFFYKPLPYIESAEIIADIDSQYNRIWVYEQDDPYSERRVRCMTINRAYDKGIDTAMFIDNGDLALRYTYFYRLDRFFNPDIRKGLILGGGGGSITKDFLERFPEGDLDVVEIDPKVTQLAREYFNLKDSSRFRVFDEDGRVFINRTNNKYDAIYIDVFKSFYSLPYQLTTLEAVQEMYRLLNDNGVVLVNILSAIEGDKGKFLRAEYLTYKQIFPQVLLFPVRSLNSETIQNIMFVAIKSDENDYEQKILENLDFEIEMYLQHLYKKRVKTDLPILTDEYAPVDNYILEML